MGTSIPASSRVTPHESRSVVIRRLPDGNYLVRPTDRGSATMRALFSFSFSNIENHGENTTGGAGFWGKL